MARTEALVNPLMLRWARETAGYTLAEAAARLRGVRDPETELGAWEGRERWPSVPQARKLAALYKRPLAVFTLMHELAHVALHSEGLCNLEDRAAKVEAFCNRVAAALLMPAELFRAAAAPLVAGARWPDARLEDLAAQFSVSRDAVYVRLVSLRLAEQAQYDAWRAALTAQLRAAPAHREQGAEREGGPSFYQLYLHRMSFPYLQRVFESYHADQISLTELSDHLGVKPSTALALEDRFLERLRARAS
jgi:Zn-dependent peptidase ImmA (M78 family)